MAFQFTLGTWNILATAYIRPEYYPYSPPDVLDPAWRIPALIARARQLALDILCVQEIEHPMFDAMQAALAPLGYSGVFDLKGSRKPDGCATFFRADRCTLASQRRLAYADGLDGGPDSGHIAQSLVFDIADSRVALINTHLKWEAHDTPYERRWSLRQARHALAEFEVVREGSAQIFCGDLNALPTSPLIELLQSAGFKYTHQDCPGIFTCNSNRVAKLVDYIFYRGPWRAEPSPVPAIDSSTPLPSLEEPSDHLPLIARFSTP
jgi:mRNA deadenylase 3'-5' endonuclease subunit Ccr4